METVPVIVLNWNGLEDTVACVEALLLQQGATAEIHVVDNGSAGNEADRLEQRFGREIHLHRSPSNLGFTGGNNLALHAVLGHGKARFVALLNNDTVADPHWLAELVAAAIQEPTAGLFSSRMLFHHDPDRIENAGIELLTSFDALPRGRGKQAAHFLEPTWLLGACAGAALYRVEMLAAVGVLREDFFANYEDLELSLRALACGWRCRYVPRASVRHKLNASFEKLRDPSVDARSLRNAAWACLANLPWQVILLNLPWVLLRDLSVLGLAPFTGRVGLARALLASRRRLWQERRELLAARRALAPKRRGAWWRIWWAQKDPLQRSPRLLWNLLRGRQKS